VEGAVAANKLLVVEDDPSIADALELYGKATGFDVQLTSDGERAVEICRTQQPDVILLDIALPGMDGRDVMLRLRQLGVTQKAVVIFVTARDSQSDRILGLELGADDYETKPLHFRLLFRKIERLLEKKRTGTS
jgi:two-component system alkaline phosphatase synthesis response regulator PhoP